MALPLWLSCGAAAESGAMSSSEPTDTPSGSEPTDTPSGSEPTDTPSGSEPADTPSGSDPASVWPGGKRAAVSLTYDDGLDSHLGLVVPALDRAGLKGTFFVASFPGVDHDWALPNTSGALSERHRAWQAVARSGHELAGHTVNHPCPPELNAGQPEGFRLGDYDLARMARELDDSVHRLARLGAQPPLSFAYPCESDRYGLGPDGTDYAALVHERFAAARGSRTGLAQPESVNLFDVPVTDTQGLSGEQLRALVDQATAQGAWLVLLFHGVGEPAGCPDLTYRPGECALNYLVTSGEAHDALLSYLTAQKQAVWTATFGEVAQHLRQEAE